MGRIAATHILSNLIFDLSAIGDAPGLDSRLWAAARFSWLADTLPLMFAFFVLILSENIPLSEKILMR